MATPVPDYTNRDYASLVDSLLDLAAVRLPEWTDRSENDLGRLLLELFAYVGDTLLYYQDRACAEAFLATALERRSVIDLLELIGYTLGTPAPAAVGLELTPQDPTAPLRVDVGARFASAAAPGAPPVEFAYLPQSGTAIDLAVAGPGPVRLTALNATPVESPLGASNGEASQGFAVPQRPVLLSPDPRVPDGFEVSLQIAGVRQRWERRVTLLNSVGDDPHYVVRVDEDDAAEIVFGDGRYGRVPPLDALVSARYRIGGGSGGNVAPGTVTVVTSGVSAQVSVTNPVGASGGADRETIEHARAVAPGVFRSHHRAVTAEDFVALAESFPGVARAQAVPTAWNYVDVLVVAEGGLDLSDALRGDLLRWFEDRRMATTIVHVRVPVFVAVDADVRVRAEPTFFTADVQERVRANVAALFATDRLAFGRAFSVSKLYEAAEGVDGVADIDVVGFGGRRSFPANDPVAAAGGRIPLRPREFPRRGSVTVTMQGGL